MKKNLILATVVLALPVSAMAQGQITWGNVFGTGPAFTLLAPIYGLDSANPQAAKEGNTAAGRPAGTQTYGGALLQGTGFTIGLFVGQPGGPLQQRQTASFRTGGAAGTMFLLTPTFQDFLPGTPVSVQLRAWDNRNGSVTSWNAVMADPTIPQGMSALLAHVLGGVLPDGSQFPVQQTTGVRSFQLTAVPEPSLIAFGALGLGALLLRRRK